VPRDPHARAAISLAQIGGCQKLEWFVCSMSKQIDTSSHASNK
jgi:hypothetical protein